MTIAAIVILSAIIGGMSGALITLVFDLNQERK